MHGSRQQQPAQTHAAQPTEAAPETTRSRFSEWVEKMRNASKRRSTCLTPREPRDMKAATMEPMWIMGPYFPRGRPAATAKIVPNIFAKSVRRDCMLGMRMPLRKACRVRCGALRLVGWER